MKSIYTLGDLLLAMREEKKVSQIALCKGLCSQPALSRIEKWERKPSRLLLNTLFQRLGKSSEYIVTVLKPEELAYFEWKAQVYKSLEENDEKTIRVLLRNELAKNRTYAHRIQEQFYQYVLAYIKKDYENMKKALEITMPDLKKGISSVECMGTEELLLLLLYYECKLKAGEPATEELKQCINYIEQNYEEEELINLYPKAVLLLCKYGKVSIYERVFFCKRAIEYLREQLQIREMPVLLKQVVTDMKELGAQEAEQYEEYVWAFEKIYRESGLSWENELMNLFNVKQEVHILGDLIKICRKESGMSRESASADICDILTIGRIETKTRGIKNEKYLQFSERLNMPYRDAHCAKMVTNKYKCLQVGEEIQRNIRQTHYDNLLEKVQWLKSNLDMENPQNRQYVEMEENVIENVLGRRDVAEFGERAKEILKITVPNWSDKDGSHFYTGVEIQLVHHIATAYVEQGQYEQCERIVKKMWDSVSVQQNIITKAKELLPPLTAWMRALYRLERLDEALQVCNLGIVISLKSGYGDKLDYWIYEKNRVLEKNSVISLDKAREYVKQAYCFCLIYKRNDMADLCLGLLNNKYSIN